MGMIEMITNATPQALVCRSFEQVFSLIRINWQHCTRIQYKTQNPCKDTSKTTTLQRRCLQTCRLLPAYTDAYKRLAQGMVSDACRAKPIATNDSML
jgi:hypothetical protein